MKTYRIFVLLFWLNALIHVLAIILNIYPLILTTKPLIMPILALMFFFNTRKAEGRDPVYYVYLAMLFSFFGDVLLMFMDQGEIWFVSGLSAFLLAQVFYVITYRHFRFKKLNTKGKGIRMIYTSIVIIYTVILWISLYPHLEEMLLPVTLYTITIFLMVIMAIYRHNRTSALSFYLVLSGAVIFLISDSIIAINKFMVPVMYERLYVIITYMIAQFLIIIGLTEHVNLQQGLFAEKEAVSKDP